MTLPLKYDNWKRTTLAGPLGALGVSVDVVDGSVLPEADLATGTHFYLVLVRLTDHKREAIKVTHRAGNTLTVTRAAAPLAFETGDRAELWFSKEMLDEWASGLPLTPQMFGARGDGVTDDTAAVQQACDFAAAVGSAGLVFAPGTYLVSGLTLTAPLVLQGMGGGEYHSSTPQLKLSGSAEYLVKFANLTPAEGSVKVGGGLRDLVLNGNGQTVSDALLVVEGFSKWNADGCGFHNVVGTGVRARILWDSEFRNCMWRGIDARGAGQAVILIDAKYNVNNNLNVNNLKFLAGCHFERHQGPYFLAHADSNLDVLMVESCKFEWGLDAPPADGPWYVFDIRNGYRVRIRANSFTHFRAANKYHLFRFGVAPSGAASFAVHDNDVAFADANTVALSTLGQARGRFYDNDSINSSSALPTFSIASDSPVQVENLRNRDTGTPAVGTDNLKNNTPLTARGIGFLSVHDLTTGARKFVADAGAINTAGTVYADTGAYTVLASLPLHLFKGLPGPLLLSARMRSASGAGTVAVQAGASLLSTRTAGAAYGTLTWYIPAATLATLGDNAADRLRLQAGPANAETVYLDGIYLLPLPDGALSVKHFGAVGDGVTDDAPAFAAAGTASDQVLVPAGTYRIATTTSISASLVPSGGIVSVDAGATFTCGGVIGDPARVVFSGAGTVKTTNNGYSAGWYAGSSANEKWDFLRRALVTNTHYEVLWPRPHSGDPAESGGKWKVTGSLYFDDPENEGLILTEGAFICTASVDGVFVFSPVNKTEHIRFPLPLLIYGNNLGNGLLDIRGGARIQFHKVLLYQAAGEGLRLGGLWPCDEITLDWLETTGFTTVGVQVTGNATPYSVVLACGIGYLFSNGGSTGCTNLVKIQGLTRDLTIDRIFENIGAPFTDWSGSTVSIVATSEGSSRYGTRLGHIYQASSALPAVECIDASGGAASKHSVHIGSVFAPNVASDPIVAFSWNHRSQLLAVLDESSRPYHVSIASASLMIDLPGIDLNRVAFSGTPMPARTQINGRYQFRVTLDDDAATYMALPSSTNGLVTVICENDSNAVVCAYLRAETVLLSVNIGSSATIASSTVLAGTTGADNKMNVAANSGVLYIENRLGTSRTFTVTVA